MSTTHNHKKAPVLFGTALLQLGYSVEGVFAEWDTCKVIRPATADPMPECATGQENKYTVTVESRELDGFEQIACSHCDCLGWFGRKQCRHARLVCGVAGWVAAAKAKYKHLKGYGLAWCYYVPAGKFSPHFEILTLSSPHGSYIRFARTPGELGPGSIVEGVAEASNRAYLGILATTEVNHHATHR